MQGEEGDGRVRTPRVDRAGRRLLVAAMLMFILTASAAAITKYQLRVKPGLNFFSPQQDVQLGRENAGDIDKKLPLVNDSEVVRYVNNLGRRLASFAPYNNDYAWSFKVINSKDINAFALPGGYIYVNRGAIEDRKSVV
jgi:predicted Zn-dependent protease